MSIAFLSRHEHSVRNLSENTDRVGSKIVIVVIIIIILNHQTGICRREWKLTKDWDIANVTNVTLNIENLTCGDISTPCSWFENLHCFSEDCSIGKAAARCWDLKSTLSKTNHDLFFTLDRTIPLLTCRAVTWRKTRETETEHFILISCKMELNSVLYQSEICRPDHVWVDAGTVREGGADEGKAIGAASEVWWSWRQRTYNYDDHGGKVGDNNDDTFGGSLLALVAGTLQLNIKVIIIVILFLITLIVINFNLPIPLSDNLVQLFPGWW